MKKIVILICMFMLNLSILSVDILAETNYPSYTYDFWQNPVPSLIPYRVEKTVLGTSIEIPTDEGENQNLAFIEDVFYYNDSYFFADSKISKVVVTNTNFEVTKIIQKIDYIDGDNVLKTYDLVKPKGLFVNHTGIYIIDENDGNQGYIYVLDHQFNFIRRISRPEHPTYNSSVFKPNKLVVDDAGRLYVVVIGAFEGIIELQPDGTFSRFVGVQPVQVNPLDLLWRRLLSREQLETTRLFLPVEYNGLSIDQEGFIYATSGGSEASPIQRINAKGIDVLRKNGYILPIGDIVKLPNQQRSALTSIDVNEYGMYSVIDRVNKKIFTYNSEGFLNYVIGFEGELEGNFLFPTAVRYVGDKIIVTDSTSQRTIITLFEPTEFGKLVNQANRLSYEGESIDAADVWERVLNLNANYTLAHIGIGYSYYRQGEYELAMESFRIGQDRENYSRAYEEFRKDNFEKNFPLIGLGTGLIIVLTIIYPVIKDILKKAN